MHKSAGCYYGQGTYYTARANIIPPESLQKKVFPDVSVRLRQLREGTIAQTVCDESFLNLMMKLRKSFLQDSVLMYKRHPIPSGFQKRFSQ